MFNLLPKGKYTIILVIILLYGVATYKEDYDEPIFEGLTSKEQTIETTPSSDGRFTVTSKTPAGQYLDGPTQFLLDKFQSTDTGKVVLQGIVNKTLEEKYGGQDMLLASAEVMKHTRSFDLEVGKGAKAHCGSKVKFHYEVKLKDNIVFYSSQKDNQPLEITLGQHDHMVGLDQGIEGMMAGGKRKMGIPASAAYDDTRFSRSTVPIGQPLLVTAELLSVKEVPAVTPTTVSYESIEVPQGALRTALCGSVVDIEYVPAASDGNEAPKALTVVLGQGGIIPWGVEMAIIGMVEGEVREINVVSQAQADIRNKEANIKIADFPKNPGYKLRVTLKKVQL